MVRRSGSYKTTGRILMVLMIKSGRVWENILTVLVAPVKRLIKLCPKVCNTVFKCFNTVLAKM
jgi:hypothetical protein